MEVGRKIFISYGNEKYYKSLRRLEVMAKGTGRFDEVRIFTDQDLPLEIKSHPLMNYSRGGGYWLWKPYVILSVLRSCGENDVVVYSDSGNEVFDHPEWDLFWSLLRRYNGIFFMIGGTMGQWCRKNVLDFFSNSGMQGLCLRKLYQLQSNFICVRKNAEPVIEEWYQLMMDHPEYVVDVTNEEKAFESRHFIEHRHDQAVLSCVVFNHWKDNHLKLLWQHHESRDKDGQAVFCARISDTSVRSSNHVEPFWRKYLKKFFLLPYRYLRSKVLLICYNM